MRPRNEGSTGKSSFGYSDGTLGVEKGPPGKPRAEESRVENAAGRRPTCPANNQILKAEAGSSGGSSRAACETVQARAPHHDLLRPARYSSKPACSDFTSARGIAALASSRAEPVVVCCSSSFGGWRFFAAISVADGALLRAPDLTP